jgi:hypothetical protein
VAVGESVSTALAQDAARAADAPRPLAFEDESEALAHSDAEGGDAHAAAPTGELVGGGPGEAGAGGAERVAEGDGAALRIEYRGIELGPLGDASEYLGGEGLVQLQN